MTGGGKILLLIFVILILLGFWEAFLQRRNLSRMPIRVHVNGTRGKSSVVRLIAGGLRESGIRTCAKTTGTLARMILPDASEYPVFRPGGANVIEQVRIVSAAASYDAQAIVVECMALQPQLQWMCESRFIKATHGVITNARADHLDVMGPEEKDVALALAATTPVKAKLFTAEGRFLHVFEEAARDRQTRLFHVTPDDIGSVTEEEMEGFQYVEHKENVALALQVCADLGIDRGTALRGMWKAPPDPGVMTISHIRFFGRYIYFVNVFAANDPESTERLWNMALDKVSRCGKTDHNLQLQVRQAPSLRTARGGLQPVAACRQLRADGKRNPLSREGSHLERYAGKEIYFRRAPERRRYFRVDHRAGGKVSRCGRHGKCERAGSEPCPVLPKPQYSEGGCMIEILPVSIGIGLAVSLFLSEALGMAGAGLVVPGYLALHATDPVSIIITLASGFAAFGLVRGLGSTIIIFGRRRTILMILAGYLIGMAARYFFGGMMGTQAEEIPVIGFIVPGLIAIWLDRRGVIESLSALVTASVIVRLILILIYGAELNK